MRWSRIYGKLLGALLLTLTMSVQARVLSLQMTTLHSAGGVAHGIAATLDWPEGSEQGELTLTIQKVDLPALAYSASAVTWRCPLQRQPVADAAAPTWHCAGVVQVAGQAPHPLALTVAAAGIDADLRIGTAHLALSTRTETPDLTRIHIERLPAQWLQALSASLWADGRWRSGQLSGELSLRNSASATVLGAQLKFADVAVETPDGLLASAGLAGSLDASFAESAGKTLASLSLQMRGGELLAGGLYAQLPASPVTIAVHAERAGAGVWQLSQLRWLDGDVLQVRGSAALDSSMNLSDLDVQVTLGDLAVARDRYLSGFLAPAGFPDLLLTGGLDAALTMRSGVPQSLRLSISELNAIDPRQRFVLSGLDGSLHWSAGAAVQHSEFGWSSAALYGLGIGAGRLALESAQGAVTLRKPLIVPVLQGDVTLDTLRWQAPQDGHSIRFQLGVSMRDLDMSSLCQRLGWPPFTGALRGRIPAARFENGVLALDGGLAMEVFGGRIDLSDLVLERPFGVAPSLSAGARLTGLDLEPLTVAFGFGSITGRLDGRIDNIRLVDWSPVAFDARFDTDTRWKGKRRISQDAVQDISSIGGGSGLMGGLQAQALQLFSDFGYARIGLGCKLRDNVCAMDGVSSAGAGYTIVEGAGLPRITVVGFRRRVDWPTLVARLKSATEGNRPIVN